VNLGTMKKGKKKKEGESQSSLLNQGEGGTGARARGTNWGNPQLKGNSGGERRS